ncbi:unnamed protein product, partial [Symbiodinium sp. KB8]
ASDVAASVDKVLSEGIVCWAGWDEEAFGVLRGRMLHGEPRRIDVSNRGPMIVVYTDGVLYSRLRGVTRVRYSGAKVPDALVDRWASQGKRHLIGLVEMYVLVLARFAWKEYLDFQRVLFFLDHSGVLASAIKCTSRDELWRELLLQLEIADRGSCVAWYAR